MRYPPALDYADMPRWQCTTVSRIDYLWNGTSHIEVHIVRPKRAPIPITETGYHSHFIDT